jgi:hypothetical protein
MAFLFNSLIVQLFILSSAIFLLIKSCFFVASWVKKAAADITCQVMWDYVADCVHALLYRECRLEAGVCSIPHPSKAATGGDDAYFISQDAIGIADGTVHTFCFLFSSNFIFISFHFILCFIFQY